MERDFRIGGITIFLRNLWVFHRLSGVAYRPDLARTEFLSDPDERLGWQSKSLPSDDLCTENAIMLKRFNRYPLIIDPSGQVLHGGCLWYFPEFRIFCFGVIRFLKFLFSV